MNLYDLDWTELFGLLPEWEQLGLELRREQLAAGAVELGSATPGATAALAWMAACEVFGTASGGSRAGDAAPNERDSLVRHVRALCGRSEVEALYRGQTGTLPAWQGGGAYLALVQRGVDGAGYPGSFLGAEDRKGWLAARTPDGAKPPGVAVVRDLAVVLGGLLELGEPMRLAGLISPGGRAAKQPVGGRLDLPKARLAKALCAGVRYLLLVPALDGELLPIVGVPPAVARAWSEPAPVLSPCVAPTESFAGMPLYDDLLTLLVLCSKPQRVKRGGGGLFARAEEQLRDRLPPIPGWVPTTTDPARRVEQVLATAVELGLTEVQSPTSKAPCLGLTDAGRTWLAEPRARQLERLVEPSRTALANAQEGRLRGPATWGLSPVREHVDALVAAYRTLDHPVSMEAFLAFHGTVANPLVAEAEAGRPTTDLRGDPLTPAQLESTWRRALVVVFEGFLAPFGCVTFGRESQGFSFELTSLGHHVLGADVELHADSLDPGTTGVVLVQPDFTIVLTAPAPEVEARLTPIAERTETDGTHGVGSLFRLTRASVQAGAHAGLDPEQLLDELLEHGPSRLPGNVRHEVAAWAAEVQTLPWERPLVLRCPDAATAERLVMAAGKHLELLGEVVLVLADPKQLATVTKAAAELGIHLEAPPEAVAKQRRRRGRRRYRRK